MKHPDALIAAYYELLVENKTMKELLLDSPDLKDRLTRAKLDPVNKKVFGEHLAPLQMAIEDEVEVERLMRELFARIPSDAKAH